MNWTYNSRSNSVKSDKLAESLLFFLLDLSSNSLLQGLTNTFIKNTTQSVLAQGTASHELMTRGLNFLFHLHSSISTKSRGSKIGRLRMLI